MSFLRISRPVRPQDALWRLSALFRRGVFVFFLGFVLCCVAPSQTYTISTFAGGGSNLGDNIAATTAQLNHPNGVAVDSTGNVYISDLNRVRKVSGGVITTVAGIGLGGFSGDNGPATSARLLQP